MGDIDLETFSYRLKKFRNSLGLTQKDFAKNIGITAAALSAYETNTINPSISIAKKICEKYQISLDWLCGLSEEKEIRPEINNYKDVAVRILELLELDVSPYLFYIRKEKINDEWMQHLVLPKNYELFNFIDTYIDLCNLLNNKRINQHVMDTWLTGALEELKAVPINASTQNK